MAQYTPAAQAQPRRNDGTQDHISSEARLNSGDNADDMVDFNFDSGIDVDEWLTQHDSFIELDAGQSASRLAIDSDFLWSLPV